MVCWIQNGLEISRIGAIELGEIRRWRLNRFDHNTGLFSVKTYLLAFGCGITCLPIYFIDEKAVKKGQKNIFKVPRLGVGTGADSNWSYLIFTDDRSLDYGLY